MESEIKKFTLREKRRVRDKKVFSTKSAAALFYAVHFRKR